MPGLSFQLNASWYGHIVALAHASHTPLLAFKFVCPDAYVQSGEEYLQLLHSMNGFSRERMGEESAKIFDKEVWKVIWPFLQDGHLHLSVVSTVVWGLPQKL